MLRPDHRPYAQAPEFLDCHTKCTLESVALTMSDTDLAELFQTGILSLDPFGEISDLAGDSSNLIKEAKFSFIKLASRTAQL